MIKGVAKTVQKESDYRQLKINSYSTLKDFDKNRMKFYKKYVLGDTSVQFDDDKDFVILGNLVDTLITGNQENFDNKFAVITTPKTTGQMAEFGDELWRLTKQAVNENGDITKSFLSLAGEAFDRTRFDGKGNIVKFRGKTLDEVLASFQGSQENILYAERRAKYGKTVVTLDEVSKAERIRDELLSTPWTADILTHSDTEDYEIFNQLQISEFGINGLLIKCMPDRVHIDHAAKTVQPYDLKVSYLVNSFGFSYLKQKYYIQVGVYDLGIRYFISQDETLKDYEVLPMKFIVADSTLQSKPVIWKTYKKNIEEALHGFEIGTRKYKGVYGIIEELKWCMSEQIWTTPKEIFDNGGIMDIPAFCGINGSSDLEDFSDEN